MIHSIFIQAKRQVRRAVTLVEVIFAVGVVLVGLLGVMSILPLAGRRAEDSINLNVGAAMAESIMDDLLSRRFLANGQLRLISRSDLSTAPVGTDTPVDSINSFVIDPMFCSSFEFDRGAITMMNPVTATMNGYDQFAFPYYKPDHHPYLDPLSNASVTWPTTAPQPRLHRVGIARTPSVPNGNAFIDREQALALSESVDDLASFRPKDRTRPVTFKALQGVSGGLAYGKRVPNGRYSWFATVNPLTGGRYASISVVVLRDRERSFTAPTSTAGAASDEDNATSERLAYVSYANGFQGGAGGIVHLNSSLATVSRLRPNSWIMLSRSVLSGTVDVHRWYRVVGVDGRAEEVLATDPANAANQINTWRHKVLLDGPDWGFGFVGDADNTVEDNTVATLVDGVVSVTERTVLISDL